MVGCGRVLTGARMPTCVMILVLIVLPVASETDSARARDLTLMGTQEELGNGIGDTLNQAYSRGGKPVSMGLSVTYIISPFIIITK